MSRPSRVLAGGFVAALIVPLLATTALTHASAVAVAPAAAQPAAQSTPAVALRAKKQKATLSMHPQLADPGAKARSAAKALSSMTAQFKPAKKGRPVALQRKKGSKWVTIDKAKQSKQGRVEFTAPFKRKNKTQTYRVNAAKYKGLKAKNSKGVSANKWGAPALDSAFSDDVLPTGWKHRQTDYDGFRECAKSSQTAYKVEDGAVRLSVIDDPDRGGLTDLDPKCETDYGTFDWRLTSQISTFEARSFTYGYAAARIKFQPRAGQHGSFWMQPKDPESDIGKPSDTGAEIDVIEWFGDRKKNSTEMTSFAYYYPESVQDPDAGGREHRKACGLIKKTKRYGKDWSSKYHVFSVEWTKDYYVFRIDGQETCRTSKGVSGQAQYLILSLQANSYEIPLLDGDPDAPHKIDKLPQRMYVDWVRYWNR